MRSSPRHPFLGSGRRCRESAADPGARCTVKAQVRVQVPRLARGGARLNSLRGTFAIRVGFSAAAAVLLLAGASLNVSGRTGEAALLGGVGGVLAIAAGAMNVRWKISAPLGVAALLAAIAAARFDFTDKSLPLDIGGLVVLGLGGYVGSIAYRSFTDALHRQLDEMDALAGQLEEKHRVFLAATSDAESAKPGDIASLTTSIAGQMGAGFACTYLVSADGKQFVPQPPGFGLGRMRPQAVNRIGAGPLLGALASGKDFVGVDKSGLTELVNYVPDDLQVQNLLAVPLRIGDHLGGFILLGNKRVGFTDDDLRLATTLMLRAGTQLASSDAGRVALFQPDDTFLFVGEPSAPSPIDGPLVKVRGGESILRSLVTFEEGIYSGLQASEGGAANEALIPIRTQNGVLG